LPVKASPPRGGRIASRGFGLSCPHRPPSPRRLTGSRVRRRWASGGPPPPDLALGGPRARWGRPERPSGSRVLEDGADSFSQGRYVCAWNRKSLQPGRTPQSGQHIAESRRAFAWIPRRGCDARNPQVLTGAQVPDHDQGIEPERHGGGTFDDVLGTILGVRRGAECCRIQPSAESLPRRLRTRPRVFQSTLSLVGCVGQSLPSTIDAGRTSDAGLSPPMTGAWRLSLRSRRAQGIREGPTRAAGAAGKPEVGWASPPKRRELDAG